MGHISHEAVEQLAALILAIGGAIFLVLSVRRRPIQPGSAVSTAQHDRSTTGGAGSPPPVARSFALILAGLSAGAAVIHLVAAPSHYAEIGDLASGFVVAAIFQFAWIRWCLAGPGRRAATIGIAGNLAIVAAWAWTRTIGLPIGAMAGSPEPVGYPDSASVVFELLLVAGLVARLMTGRFDRSGSYPGRRGLRTLASVAVVPVVGLVLVLTSLATVAIASGFEHGRPAVDQPMTMEHVAAP